MATPVRPASLQAMRLRPSLALHLLALALVLRFAPSEPTPDPLDGPVGDFYFATEQQGWVVVGADTLLTFDGGQHWRRLPGVPFAGPGRTPTSDLASLPCSRLAASVVTVAVGGSPAWQLCGGVPATDMQSKQLWRSDDAGRSWSLVAETLPLPGQTARAAPTLPWVGHLNRLFFLDDQHGWLTLGRNGDLLSTQDGGHTWRAWPVSSFDGPGTGQVQFLSPTVGYVWVGTGRGSIRMTRDGGATWSQLFPPQPEWG
jgi:photosystem II stability/assembly factor-like uncharacterized protein